MSDRETAQSYRERRRLPSQHKDMRTPGTTNPTRDQSGASSGGTTAAQVQADLEQQPKQANQRMRPEPDSQRNQAQREASKLLDRVASAAIQQTERGRDRYCHHRIAEALDAIEQATGKIDILLSRNPATALIPVNTEVNVIDTPPQSEASGSPRQSRCHAGRGFAGASGPD